MTQALDLSAWTGRSDCVEGPAGLRWHEVVRPLCESAAAGVAILGFACDEGVRRNGGRVGAAGGPAAIRAMLANMPAWPGLAIFETGDVACAGEALEAAQNALAERVAAIMARGLLPIVLGGGHEVAFGSYGGLARHLARDAHAPRVGILNIDAHFDLRADPLPSSGTPFRQILEDAARRGWSARYAAWGISLFANTRALFERAADLGVMVTLDEALVPHRWHEAAGRLAEWLADVDHVYLSIDLDALPAGVASGVSAPAARGIDIAIVEEIVDAVAASGKLRLADLAELNPNFDIDGRTARIAARLAARIALRAGTGGPGA